MALLRQPYTAAPPKRRRCSPPRWILSAPMVVPLLLLLLAPSLGPNPTTAAFVAGFGMPFGATKRHGFGSILRSTTNDNDNDNDKNSVETSFSSDELVAMAQEYVANPSPDWWDDDFVFRGPVIGPLTKADLIGTLTANLELAQAFPDLEANAFGFVADDPIEPNRVWYFVRPRGTFKGPFNHPVKGLIEPTNAPYIAPPEVRSVIFAPSGKIRYQTVGYVVDRFTGDTTGGRGAVFGQYAVMGEEIDPNPGSWTTILLQKLGEFLPGVPKSYSQPETVPKWWTDERQGAEL